MSDLNQQFKRSLNSLNEIRLVVPKDYEALVSQAEVELLNLNLLALNQGHSRSQLPHIHKLLCEQIRSLIHLYVNRNEAIKSTLFELDDPSFSLNAWDKLIYNLDHVVKLLGLLPLEGNLIFSLKRDRLVISAQIKKVHMLDRNRTEIYRETRFWLTQSIFLTHTVNNNDAGSELNLILDFSYDAGNFLTFDFAQTGIMAFPLILDNYKTTEAKLDKHLVLLLDKNYQLAMLSEIPKEIINESHSFTLYHFSFLFRPLSLIISHRGKSASHDELKQVSQKRNVQIIDFFSLFNK